MYCLIARLLEHHAAVSSSAVAASNFVFTLPTNTFPSQRCAFYILVFCWTANLYAIALKVFLNVSSMMVQDYPGMSLLEQSLLRKFAGPLPVVAIIASFLSFSRNAV